jgi:hypothetical protein
MLRIIDYTRPPEGGFPFATPADPSGVIALHDFVREFSLNPDELFEDWGEDCALHAHLLLLDGDKLVGSGMIVVDPESADMIARIVQLALRPGYRSDFVIESFEDTLVEIGALDPSYGPVATSSGRLIPLGWIGEDEPILC